MRHPLRDGLSLHAALGRLRRGVRALLQALVQGRQRRHGPAPCLLRRDHAGRALGVGAELKICEKAAQRVATHKTVSTIN